MGTAGIVVVDVSANVTYAEQTRILQALVKFDVGYYGAFNHQAGSRRQVKGSPITQYNSCAQK